MDDPPGFAATPFVFLIFVVLAGPTILLMTVFDLSFHQAYTVTTAIWTVGLWACIISMWRRRHRMKGGDGW